MRSESESLSEEESGFGLVEIVVAMLILGLVAISFLPLLIQGVRVAAANKTLASATQLLQDQLEQARAKDSCAGIVSLDGTGLGLANADFAMDRVVENAVDPTDPDACPATYPGVVRLSVKVFTVGDAEPLVEAVTLVLVKAP